MTHATNRVGLQRLGRLPTEALRAAVLEVVRRESQGYYGGCTAILVYANAPGVPGYPQTCGRMSSPVRWEHTVRALRDLVRSGVLEVRAVRGPTPQPDEYRPRAS